MVGKKPEIPEKALASIEEGALLNASKHGGRAEVGAVVGRILAEYPELRKAPGEVAKTVQSVVKRVNQMDIAKQEALLKERYPGAERPAHKEGRVGLPPLPNAVKGKTAFRLPPEPSGFMTIGHAMAFTVNYLYKEEYDGELWLRFEDTNPKKVAPRYYENFRSGAKWLGIEWDHEKNVSDDMEAIYPYGMKLLEEGKAYACSCDAAKVKKLRFAGEACEHRDSPEGSNLRVWDELLAKKHREGEYVIRFKGDMQNLNYSLRDTNIFRVIDQPHPLTGDRYSLWPTYDVANAVEDEICGITHILRSSEFRNELQQLIRVALGFRSPEVIQFSRFNFKGTPVAKRLLRPLVEQKLVSGWDDPRMPTVDGLKRRGITPEAIRDFTLRVGYTKTEHEYDWSILMSINRKLLDPRSKRVFFVPDPVELDVEGAPRRKVMIPFHPEKDLGGREIEAAGKYFVSKADIQGMKKGDTFRLMDLYNVELISRGLKPVAKYEGDELVREMKKIQWVTKDNVEVELIEPGLLFDEEGSFNKDSLEQRSGLAEAAFGSLKVGEIVQFPRVGFCRVDAPRTCILTSR